MKAWRRSPVWGCALLPLLVAAAAAWGHAVLLRSAPANRAVLSQPPARVELWFSERIEPVYARLTVEDPGGTRVDNGEVTVDPDDPRKVSVALGTLAPGHYTVRYRVLSVDGHIVESQLAFTVRGR